MPNGFTISFHKENKKSLKALIFEHVIERKTVLKHIFNLFIKPHTKTPENEWREIMFNILLLGSIVIMSVVAILLLFERNFPSFSITLSLITLVILILGISRSGHYKIALWTILSCHLLVTSYFAYRWSIMEPEVILSYSLLITFSGVLFNRHTTLILTGLIASYLSIIGFMQGGDYTVSAGLSERIIHGLDGVQYSIMLLVVTLIGYLSRGELEKLLMRAKTSEAMLKAERDELEIKIREGKKKLKAAELERLSHLYRFAEFGKLSSGLFHDLINPLTAMSLYLDDLACSSHAKLPLELKRKLEATLSASKRMEAFILAIRKQLAQESDKKTFSAHEEVHQAIELLSHRAHKEAVKIVYKNKDDIYMYGNPLRFYQVVLNLISNAIDAYRDTHRRKDRVVEVGIRDYYESVNTHVLRLTVKDYGTGIGPEMITQVFEPFFTTKDQFCGSGIGLSTTKCIIEKDFGGHIEVSSIVDEGTLFTVTLPIIEYS